MHIGKHCRCRPKNSFCHTGGGEAQNFTNMSATYMLFYAFPYLDLNTQYEKTGNAGLSSTGLNIPTQNVMLCHISYDVMYIHF